MIASFALYVLCCAPKHFTEFFHLHWVCSCSETSQDFSHLLESHTSNSGSVRLEEKAKFRLL